MSQHLFHENAKKSRRKAIALTIMFHVLIIGGIVYASLGESSETKAAIEKWMDKTPEDDPVSMI